MKELTRNFLDKELDAYKVDKAQTIFRHALVKNTLMDVVANQDEKKDIDFNFDVNVKTMKATNQKASGRCWIFAATNVIRERIANELDLEDFEVSQSYLAFYDKLEKCNYFMESVMELLDEDYDERTLSFLLKEGVGDGGQWDMIVSLINKYGVCPKNVYDETANSSNTNAINNLLNFNLRKFASEAKVLKKEKGLKAVEELKENYIKKIYRLLISLYGVPPTNFDFEYTNKKGEVHHVPFASPLAFKEKYLGGFLDEFVSLINAPTASKPFNKTFTVKYLGNVAGGKPVTHLNLEMDRMKDLIVKQLKDNQIVWFGSDVGFFGDRKGGVWSDTSFDFETPTGLNFFMDKGESLDFRASAMNHAMCITGVGLNKDVPTKWKIENSWGSENGHNGYYIMSASWFDQFVYQAVINKKYLSAEELEILKGEPIELKPWDPMGSLAK